MMDLKNMTIEELEELIDGSWEGVGGKKCSESEEFEFEFSATSDPRKV